MKKSDFGMVGLGVMGQNFVLNLERNGNRVSVYERVPEVAREYMKGAAAGKNIIAAFSIGDFVQSIERPRRVMVLVKAGAPVDSTLQQFVPLLEKGDLIIDGGNSHFLDTERRQKELENAGIHFVGMGVSGGEEGALHGPSLMPGGAEPAYRSIEGLLKKVAAKVPKDGTPCVTYIGPRGSGHYVKMVHNGIEYGDMQLIAEAYDILRRGLGLGAEELHTIFSDWNKGRLSSFLVEITSKILTKTDEGSSTPLVDVILDKAGQKGTGKWTVQSAADIGAAVPTIAAALDARILSGLKDERRAAARILSGPEHKVDRSNSRILIDAVEDALYASKVCSYAQGMGLLRAASGEFGYHLDLAAIAGIWRAGCIIRAELLNEIAGAFSRNQGLPNLLVDDGLRTTIDKAQPGWRSAVRTAVELGIPVPAMSASLAYYDAYRSERLPANIIQAQRDYFGAHTFERIDRPGSFHADW